MILRIDPDGTIRAVHTDRFPMSSLGTMQMERASTVEFNEVEQTWEVRWSGEGAVVFAHPVRSECIRWEIEQLERTLAS